MTAPGISMRQLVEGMALGFDSSAGPEPSAIVELAFTGDDRGTYQLVMRNGGCRFEPRPVEVPTLRIETDGEVWRAVVAGRLQAVTALLDGRLKADGDLGLLQRLPFLFRRVSPADLRAPPDQRPPGPVPLPAMAWLFLGLLPWKTFWVLCALGGPQLAVLLAALVAGVLLAAREASGGATFLERATAMVFGAAGAASIAGARLPENVVAESFLALAAIWAASVAHARYPLTGEYSRWNYAPRVWSTGLFGHPNALLTLFWAAIFAALVLPDLAAAQGWLPHPVSTALNVAICLAGGEFTRRHERGAGTRRIDDLDAGLARLRTGARLLLGIVAGAFLLAAPNALSAWSLAPAAALLTAALWRRDGADGTAPAPVPARAGGGLPDVSRQIVDGAR